MTDRSAAGRLAARPPLPTDPAACPPLEPAFGATLDVALTALALRLTRGQRSAIEAQARLLAVWNGAINLTAIRSPTGVARDHVADALTAIGPLRELGEVAGVHLLDLGSGAGYPGLPLGLVLRSARLTLVDSVTKKARFLEVVAAAATEACRTAGEAAPAISVEDRRAETLAGDPRCRARHDLVTVRAVGTLRESVELGLPLLRTGGRLVAWKREAADGRLAGELAEAAPLVGRLGGLVERIVAVELAGLEDHRLVIVRAERPSPAAYPRPPAERRRDRP